MSNYKFVEPADESGKLTRECIYTRQMILDEYYDYWVEQMLKAGKPELICEEYCIEDWLVVHWASETDEPPGTKIYKSKQ